MSEVGKMLAAHKAIMDACADMPPAPLVWVEGVWYRLKKDCRDKDYYEEVGDE